MQITYRNIDWKTFDGIRKRHGEAVARYIHLEEGSFSVAALCDGALVGLISSYTRTLPAPLEAERDAYIDIIEVEEAFRRRGIASEMIRLTEEWAAKAGFLQICAWSNRDKVEAMPMWRDLGYGLCPAKIWLDWVGEAKDGYCVVKQLNRTNPFPHITQQIKRELRDVSGKMAANFRLLRAKDGVFVYECTHDDRPTVVKFFERDEDRREIRNYRLLQARGVPTIPTYALGESCIAMEDISRSGEWRLGTCADMDDAHVARGLARWYFALHEAGANVPELDALYFEYDEITRENIAALGRKLPEAAELFSFLLDRFDALRALIERPQCTLTYNDFHWTNFIVRRDGQAALMFDYNLLGRGYRYSDFRNLRSLSGEAYRQFTDEYGRLYHEKHGIGRNPAEMEEAQIDAVAAPLFALMAAYQRERFPDWGEDEKQAALDGTLLEKAKQLLT